MIDPSRLTKSIVIERGVETTNVANETELTWLAHLVCYAQVIPLSAREVFQSGRDIAFKTARFFIHYQSDIKFTDRINYDNYNWDILSISDVGEREGVEILAEVRNA